MDKKIWVLLDDRQGNSSQSIGVAEALGLPYQTKQIDFNAFIRLPNLLINHSKLGLKEASSTLITPPFPDIVIATARRLGIVASYIKHQNPATFVIQIQNPGKPLRQFDLIAAPKHDNLPDAANIIHTVGAPHRVTLEKLAKEAALWQERTQHLTAPKIAVLVGGSVRTHEFAEKHGVLLATLASQLANTLNGSLMVTTSRRTGTVIPKIIEANITAPQLFHTWNDKETHAENPFYGFLGLADYVIVTGDSISMCSEACATGKPVYIYTSPDFVPPKHQQFIDYLYELGLARPLQAQGNEPFTPPFRMDDALHVANEVRKRLSLVEQDSQKSAIESYDLTARANVSMNMVSKDAVKYAEERSAELVGKKWVNGELVDNPDAKWAITDSTREMIRQDVQATIEGKNSIFDLQKKLMDNYAFSKERAATIMRTEMSFADMAGTIASYRRANVAYKTWLIGLESCPECRQNHAEGAIPFESNFSSGDFAPPAHPNCVCDLGAIFEGHQDKYNADLKEKLEAEKQKPIQPNCKAVKKWSEY